MSTPICRCGHPSHYHEGGGRPYGCEAGGCDCSDFWPTDADIESAKVEAVECVVERLVPPQHRQATVRETAVADMINHPPHYGAHPSGVTCIQITEHMNFCLGNVVKYIWRSDLKDDAVEDLSKAAWYLDRELQRRRSTG